MESPLFFLLLTTIALTDQVHCQSIHASMNPLPVGSNVTLISSRPIFWGEWIFNKEVLVIIAAGNFKLRQAKSDRVTYNVSTSWLHISSATLEDSGEYILEEFDEYAVKLQLSVQEPISNVTLSAKAVDLVEFNDTAVLMCSVSTGTSLSYQWWAGNSTISSGPGVEFRNESATLCIFGVSRNDQGPYRCNVSNGLGYEVSPPVSLNISYGPGNTTMTVMPHQSLYRSGSNITLSCSTDSKPTAKVQWMFNETDLDHWGSQLYLQNVQVNDTGTYKCISRNSATMLSSSKSTDIRVMEPISDVTLSAKAVDLVEFNDTAVLMCSVSTGTSLSYQWFARNSTISSGPGVEFMNENATLCIFGVSRNDQGPYRCKVSNELGYEVSPPVNLNISYGPNDTMMTVMPEWHVHSSGSNITLSCSSDSKPTAMVRWMFNDTYLDHWGSQLDLQNVQENRTGTYKCVFHNVATMRFSSKSKDIRVMDPIRRVQVQAEMKPAVEGHSYDLTCSVEGTAEHIYWMRNGEKLHPDNRTVILNNNMTIRFMSIHRNDTEDYKCIAMNILGNMTSMTFRPSVKYGPMMPTIMGPKMAILGSNVTLSCMAESVPPSLYWWYFNGTLVSNMSKYMTPPLTKNMSGKYVCVAYNNITGKNSTASMTLTAMDVEIDTPASLPLEGSSYELTCSVSVTFDHIYWMKNWEKLHPDNDTAFSMDNKTVTFMPVDRYDTGKYKCMGVHAIGNVTSLAYMLQVNFGPDEPVIDGPEYGEMGRDAVFHCSASSMPASTYTWWFDGSLVANTSEFIAGPLSFNMSGEYTCMAHNHVTGKNSTNSTMLTVIEGIESVMIQGNATPVINENFTLLCHVVGPYDTIYWMKDDMQLNMNETDPDSYMYNIEENMLHFTPLTRESAGIYWCVATNRAAHHNSPQYRLLVSYGPLNVSISGPGTGREGDSVTLQCTADSRPECDFEWFLNNQTMPLWSGSVMNFNVTKEKEGTYICIATNPVSNMTMMQNKTFAIENHASGSHIPNKGALLLLGLCSFFTHLLFL